MNLKPYRVLPLLGYSINPVNDGDSNRVATEEIAKVKRLLQENGLSEADFILTDFFIAYLFYHVFDLQFKREEKSKEAIEIKQEPKKAPALAPPADGTIVDTHEAAEAILLKLGNLLGYDTYTPDSSKFFNGQKLGDIATLEQLPFFTSEKIMDSVQNIDVVWMKEEWPRVFFRGGAHNRGHIGLAPHLSGREGEREIFHSRPNRCTEKIRTRGRKSSVSPH